MCQHTSSCPRTAVADGLCERHLVAGSKPVSAKPVTRRQRKKGPKRAPKHPVWTDRS
jgi:hypothetical protein